TGPVHGFENANDYYTRSSCRQFLRGITRLCLIIHARDDPFMHPDVIPAGDELSDSTELALSNYGGHAGFVYGSLPTRPNYWLEQRIPEYLQEQLVTR
ncbi:MAG: hydrolase, partial [Gammaproteobacteria bacterium]|nr:hydrolase [Gammaproteobacteria bacterium]